MDLLDSNKQIVRDYLATLESGRLDLIENYVASWEWTRRTF
jgi:hypothetical protein